MIKRDLAVVVMLATMGCAPVFSQDQMPATPGDTFDYKIALDQRPKLDFDRTRVTVGARPGEVPVHRPAEKIDRGMMAIRLGNCSVYIGWRLLADDHERVAFHVERAARATGPFDKISERPVADSTNVTDAHPPADRDLYYRAVVTAPKQRASYSKVVTVRGGQADGGYIALPLPRGAVNLGGWVLPIWITMG